MMTIIGMMIGMTTTMGKTRSLTITIHHIVDVIVKKYGDFTVLLNFIV